MVRPTRRATHRSRRRSRQAPPPPRIDRGDDGRIMRVKIVLRNGDSAWVPARDLRYDPEDRLVFTDLSIDDIYAIGRNS